MPTPAPLPDPTHAVVHSFLTALGRVPAQQPWIVVVLVIGIVAAVVPKARIMIHSGPRDATRDFSRADKAMLLSLAGDRCEHHSWAGGRCRAVNRLQADHIHPWSRGGWTNVRNGQVLCRSHNLQKSAAIPWDRSLRRLAERRAGYCPAGADRVVVRHARSATPSRYDA